MSFLHHAARSALVAALLSPLSFSQDATITASFAGSNPGEALASGAFLGDINGDGRAEFVLAAPGFDSPTKDHVGRVTVLDGASQQELWSRVGSVELGALGSSLAALTDVNGDGLADLAVGAPALGSSTQAGEVFVFSGADGEVLAHHTGDVPGDQFGWSVAGMPDANGNGRPELLIGAPGVDLGPGLEDAGRAVILDPLDGTLLRAEVGEAGDMLGVSVSGGAGNLAATPWMSSDTPTPTIGWSEEGLPMNWLEKAYPSFGASQAAKDGRGYVRQYDAANSLSGMLREGHEGDDLFGSQLTELGDLDGDGVSELLVFTEPRLSDDDTIAAGYAEVIDRMTATSERLAFGLIAGNDFGASGVGPGDVDGDGIVDYVIAEPLDDTLAKDGGHVVVFSGADHSLLAELFGSQPGERLGRNVFATGDLNGDGLADFGIGAEGHGEDRGRVDLVTLTPWSKAGAGTLGSAGTPKLRGHGGLVAGRDVSLVLEGAAPLSEVSLVYGSELVLDAEGVASPSADVLVAQLKTDAEGRLVHSFEWPAGLASGTTTYFQYFVADLSGASGPTRSNVLAGTVR